MPKSLFVDPNETLAAGKIKFKDIPVNVYNKTSSRDPLLRYPKASLFLHGEPSHLPSS